MSGRKGRRHGKKSRFNIGNMLHAYTDTVLGLGEWRMLSYECKVAYVVRAISVLLSSAATVIFFRYCFMAAGESVALSYVLFNFYLFPMIFIVCMYGLSGGLVSFSIMFVAGLFIARTDAYMFSYNLFALFIVAAMKEPKRTGTPKKALLFGAVMAIVMSCIYTFIFLIVGQESFSTLRLSIALVHMGMVVPQTFLSVLWIYFLQNRFPKGLRPFFARFEHEHRSGLSFMPKENEGGRTTSISRKLFIILGTEAVMLGIFAAAFANSLIPNLTQVIQREDAIGKTIANAPIVPEQTAAADIAVTAESDDTASSEEEAADDEVTNEPFALPTAPMGGLGAFADRMGIDDTFNVARRMEEMERFRYNDEGIAFDIKLVLLIIDIIAPIVLIANYIGQRLLARPIIMITDAMNEFTRSAGDDKKRMASARHISNMYIRTGDEIESLYDSLVKTTTEVSDYIDHMQEEQQLKEDLRVAKASSEAKSNFLSNVSHEIRTPINAVLGLDEMILRESDDKTILKYAMDIKNSGKSLLGLVNDLLDFSKIEAGKMEIIPVEYELSSVINDLINMVAVKAADKGLKLDIDVDKTIPHILFGDEIRIKQCVLNILNNAVKYTEEGSVTLSINHVDMEKAAYEGDDEIGLTFRVVDTGIGIKEEDIEKLYAPFERIEESRNRTIEGTGLGMSIVKQLLELMDSRLIVKSEYGKGSDFSFTVVQKVISREEIGDFNETYERSLNEAEDYKVSFVAPDARILVVDDTPMNLTVVKGLLKETMLKVDTATSGFDALDKVADTEYDMIFLDQRMPKMDGTQTLAAMRELKDNRSAGAPVIALTANAVSGSRENFIAAGFNDYISKPIDAVRLEKLIASLLPWEKVYMRGSADYESLTSKKAGQTSVTGGISNDTDVSNSSDGSGDRTRMLKSIEGIDYDAGVSNCGNEDILYEAIGDFRMSLKTGPDEIEGYRSAGDVRNYTVKVHALKSSARLIGAMELSKQAEYLEKCGDDNNIEDIDKLTPDLLALYRSYEDRFKALDVLESKDESDKPLIDGLRLEEGYAALKEAAEAFDFDTADAIIEMLNEYTLPMKERGVYDMIKDKVRMVDRDGVLELLDGRQA